MHDTPDGFNREYQTQAKGSETQETVATYLNKRLVEIGVGHVFAIPGDYVAEYVATLDDPATNAGLVRVHPNNEMCATYAADGYGRATNDSVGCVAFTYGVGAINAAQAVAGAFVERVPLVLINGSPSIAQFDSTRDQGVLYHHMLDGSHTDQRIFAEMTEIAVRIDNPATAPALIDAALTTCITASRPVYIEIVNQTGGMACASVPSTPLCREPVPPHSASLTEAANAVEAHLRSATNAVVVAGSEIARSGLQEPLAKLLAAMDVPYVTSPLGKSVLSEFRDDLRFSGVYFGKSSPPEVQDLMTSADCVLALGVQDTDFNYLGIVTPDYVPGGTDLPGPTHIQARDGAVLVGRQLAYWGDVGLAALLDELLRRLTIGDPLPGAPFPGPTTGENPVAASADLDPDAHLTYDSFKALLYNEFLKTHSADEYPQIIADAGFSFLSNIDLPCGEGGYIAQLAWAAIGYGVGATYGVTLANERAGRSRRTVTITGDAAFAESLNAIGTVAQLEQDAVIFVMDNRVYAVEQWLINADAFCPDTDVKFAELTEVPQGRIWDYAKLAEGFGGIGHQVETNAELTEVLEQLQKPALSPTTGKPTFTLVAVRLPHNDLPANARWKMHCDPAD